MSAWYAGVVVVVVLCGACGWVVGGVSAWYAGVVVVVVLCGACGWVACGFSLIRRCRGCGGVMLLFVLDLNSTCQKRAVGHIGPRSRRLFCAGLSRTSNARL